MKELIQFSSRQTRRSLSAGFEKIHDVQQWLERISGDETISDGLRNKLLENSKTLNAVLDNELNDVNNFLLALHNLAQGGNING